MWASDEERWGGVPDEGDLITVEVDPAQLVAVAALDPGGSVEARRACWESLVAREASGAPLARRLLELSPRSVEILCHLAGQYVLLLESRLPVCAALRA